MLTRGCDDPCAIYIYTKNHDLVYLKLIYVTYLSVKKKKRDEYKVEHSDFFSHIFMHKLKKLENLVKRKIS